MNKKLIGNSLWYFLETAISAIIGFISAPILTRVLSTEVYAQYGMLISFTTLMATFIYFGQDESFMRFFNRRKGAYWIFFRRCVTIPLLICVFMLFLILEPNHFVMKMVFASEISDNIGILIIIYIMIIVINRFLMLTARMEERAANYSISNIVNKITFYILLYVVLLLKNKITLIWIIVSLIFAVLCALIINIIAVLKNKHIENPSGDNITTKELVLFGLPFAISSTMFWGVPLLEKILIRNLSDWNILAIYSSAAIFVTAMGLVKTTVNSIWVPYVYKNYMNEKEFKNDFRKVGISLCWFCLVTLAGIIAVRRWIVCIFDSAYYNSMLIAPALVCGACFDLLTCIYSIGINIKKKTQFHIVIPFIQLVISLVILFIFLPMWGLIATGISYLFSIAISRSVQMAIALHYYGIGNGYNKLMLMLGIYMIVGLTSCFINNILFDFTCALLLCVIATIIAGKDLYIVFKNIILIWRRRI